MSQEQPCVLIVSTEYAAIRLALREAGFTTAGLPDAESATVIFDSMKPAAVVSDAEMTTNGRHTLPYFIHALSKHPLTPIVGIADRDFSQEREPPAERFTSIVRRPLRLDELTESVRAALRAAP